MDCDRTRVNVLLGCDDSVGAGTESPRAKTYWTYITSGYKEKTQLAMNGAAAYDETHCTESTELKGLDAAMCAIVRVAAAAAAVAMLAAAAVAAAIMPSATVAAVVAVLAMATIVAIPAAAAVVVAAVAPMFAMAPMAASPTETVDATKETKPTGRRYGHARPHAAIHRRSVATAGGGNGNLPPWIP